MCLSQLLRAGRRDSAGHWLTAPKYNPKRFAAVIMRIREPKTTALIFASGKMVVTGAKSEDDSKLASRKYARIIQKLGFNAKFTDFKIQNIVGSCDIKFPIRLEGLASKHHNFSSYEPELFPGLIYRMIKPKIVLLIFVSGKIVLTGAKVREEIYQAFEMIYPVLQGLFYSRISYRLMLTQSRFPQGLNPALACTPPTCTLLLSHYLIMRPRQTYPPKKLSGRQHAYPHSWRSGCCISFRLSSQHCIGVRAGKLNVEISTEAHGSASNHPHRLRMESPTPCARRQSARVDCRPNSLHWGKVRRTDEGPGSVRRLRLFVCVATCQVHAIQQQTLAVLR